MKLKVGKNHTPLNRKGPCILKSCNLYKTVFSRENLLRKELNVI